MIGCSGNLGEQHSAQTSETRAYAPSGALVFSVNVNAELQWGSSSMPWQQAVEKTQARTGALLAGPNVHRHARSGKFTTAKSKSNLQPPLGKRRCCYPARWVIIKPIKSEGRGRRGRSRLSARDGRGSRSNSETRVRPPGDSTALGHDMRRIRAGHLRRSDSWGADLGYICDVSACRVMHMHAEMVTHVSTSRSDSTSAHTHTPIHTFLHTCIQS